MTRGAHVTASVLFFLLFALIVVVRALGCTD
jgi:hypothetical protein